MKTLNKVLLSSMIAISGISVLPVTAAPGKISNDQYYAEKITPGFAASVTSGWLTSTDGYSRVQVNDSFEEAYQRIISVDGIAAIQGIGISGTHGPGITNLRYVNDRQVL